MLRADVGDVKHSWGYPGISGKPFLTVGRSVLSSVLEGLRDSLRLTDTHTGERDGASQRESAPLRDEKVHPGQSGHLPPRSVTG